jgi:hypothetical protein
MLTFSFYAKNEDAASALELKKILIAYDRSLLVADPRRMEPKKFGGRGARARRQKVGRIKAFADDSLTDKRSESVWASGGPGSSGVHGYSGPVLHAMYSFSAAVILVVVQALDNHVVADATCPGSRR